MKVATDKIKIGIVGAGAVTTDLHLPVLVNFPDVELKWICDVDEKRALYLAKLYKIPQVFSNIEQCSDVDIVLIAIPVGYRPVVMRKILKRGWHVFCEKPFAISLEEHDQYLAEAEKNSLQVGVGLVRRYCPTTVMAKKIVNGGYFGPIVEVWANEGLRTKRTGKGTDWYGGDPKIAGGGILMETGSHLIDQIFMILGVTGISLDRCLQWSFNGLEFQTKFVGSLSTNLQRDLKCSFEVSRLEDLCNGIFIQLSNFIIKCGLFFNDSLDLLTLSGEHIIRFETDGGCKTIEKAFYLEWRDFINQCITGKPSAVSADTARLSTALIEQCYQHAEQIDNKTENRGTPDG